MNMETAFKWLLDGYKITRPEWEGYIKYDKERNLFIYSSGDIIRNEISATFSYIYEAGIRCIKFNFKNDRDSIKLYIKDDNKNEIYIPESESLELDAMRWRIIKYCMTTPCSNKCSIKKNIGCSNTSVSTLTKLNHEEIKRVYGAMKEID